MKFLNTLDKILNTGRHYIEETTYCSQEAEWAPKKPRKLGPK